MAKKDKNRIKPPTTPPGAQASDDFKRPPPRPVSRPNTPQRPVDLVEIASMDSFPCSDPPGYGTGHA